MAVVFIRAIVLYLLVIFSVRFMGKHQIGELQPSELAITILISNIATLPLEDVNIPLVTGIVPIVTLAALDVIMSWVGVKSKFIRGITSGKPVVIISNGKINQKKMRDIRFTIDDLISALHSQNIFDINEVQYAVVETTGSVSVYQKYEYKNVTNADMNFKSKDINPPEVIIDDGVLIEKTIKSLGISDVELQKALKKENAKIKSTYLMTVDLDRNYTVIKKEKG